MAVSGAVKMGDVYLLVSGRTIIGRLYIPRNCFDNCHQQDCNCGAVELINRLSLSGKVVDLASCRGSLIKCIDKIEHV